MRRVSDEERRGRLAVRHRFAAAHRAGDAVEVARDLVALHSTDPASVFLAVAARTTGVEPGDIERALYEERSLVRILGMRRTMFVVPLELVAVVHAACTRAIHVGERRKLIQLLEQSGIAADSERWLRQTEAATVRALAARGEATAAELSGDVPALREKIHFGEGTKWEGVQGVVTRVLFLLSADGRIVRGRPRGSWTSSQYRWAPVESWLPGGLPELSTDAARSALVRAWLRTFGPGTAVDLRWWTGLTARQVAAALDDVGAAQVELEGGSIGLVLADDVGPVTAPEPSAALLPALDPTVMGWSDRGWFLGDQGPALFDRSGNAGPTVWWDGRVVGAWAQRKDGEIVCRLLEDVGGEARAAVDAAAARLQAWLGPTRVAPRFRTPLGREITRDQS